MAHAELCPKFEKGMQLLSKRWNGFIIYQLLSGPQRFGEIQNALPISGRLLSERLKDLEEEGIVTREMFPEVPVRVEYALTDKGRALESIIRDLEKWSEAWVGMKKEN
ncbi:winged helix-turn-helix transcriptional regulator [Tumebacillus lipolyticus]|uniref:Winged helix-turn-helix transcriptional regulator n=1 Tax=Tumebacillus lipolyticus TaxID=1280370 RepID=A0ABW4ZTK3_9BACL